MSSRISSSYSLATFNRQSQSLTSSHALVQYVWDKPAPKKFNMPPLKKVMLPKGKDHLSLFHSRTSQTSGVTKNSLLSNAKMYIQQIPRFVSTRQILQQHIQFLEARRIKMGQLFIYKFTIVINHSRRYNIEIR